MERKRYIEGFMFSGSSFVIWGLLPLYWKLLQDVSPYIVVSNRVVWSFVFVIILLGFRKKLPDFWKNVKTPRTWLVMLLPTVFICVNWILFTWAVSNNYVIECSLGYFITPLIMTVLGKVFYKEKLSIPQLTGIILAGIGVLVKAIMYGKVPFYRA